MGGHLRYGIPNIHSPPDNDSLHWNRRSCRISDKGNRAREWCKPLSVHEMYSGNPIRAR